MHLQLRDQNPVAVADVCRAYLDPLVGWLAGKYPAVDAHARQTAVHIALMNYVKAPEAYDPIQADLAAYLRMAANGDLLNLLRPETKHQKGRVPWTVVELSEETGNSSGTEEPLLLLERAEEAGQTRAFLEAVAANFTAEERRVLDLLLAGEWKNAAFAQVLGLDGLPTAEQEREVKKVKDRIKQRLKRGVPGHG